MTKKTYTLTLDKETIDNIKLKLSNYGGKLSTLINELLTKWLKEKDEPIKYVQ